jgi:hypothetical protein
LAYQQKGIKTIHIFFDRNQTHKAKMQTIFAGLIAQLTIKVHFHLMAGYSPKLNLVEYAIHLIRQKVLHHADCKKDLVKFENEVKELCDNNKVLNREQVVNILVHIEKLIPKL